MKSLTVELPPQIKACSALSGSCLCSRFTLSLLGHSLLRLGGPGPVRLPKDEVTLPTQDHSATGSMWAQRGFELLCPFRPFLSGLWFTCRHFPPALWRWASRSMMVMVEMRVCQALWGLGECCVRFSQQPCEDLGGWRKGGLTD